jgi:hypothetical protein
MRKQPEKELVDRFHETSRSTLVDLILRSPAKRSEGGRLEGWQLAQAVIRGHPARRIACAMLLRMRSGEDPEMIRTSETLY